MTPHGRIKLVSELLDLPLLDSDGKYCGIVDDVEFEGGAGKALKLKALLVGPGAYSGRLSRWAMWFVKTVVGDRIRRVPLDQLRTISNVVHLKCPARELGLNKTENAVAKWIPRRGAM